MIAQLTSHTTVTRRDGIRQFLDTVCRLEFQFHPFSNLSDQVDLEWILANYLAMSQAFPFLLAGAQKGLIFSVMSRGEDMPPEYEMTTAVMNFLCWDETGGHQAILEQGQPGLPNILETQDRFHANLLKKDLAQIFGREIKPCYSMLTQQYLIDLFNGLASLNSIQWVAAMVAFERHAQQMIEALWTGLSLKLSINKDNLFYFKIHVGGDDPAEAYHVDLTFQMIENIVKLEGEDEFYSSFAKCYALSFNWCQDLVDGVQK
jgi:hypothetical protein